MGPRRPHSQFKFLIPHSLFAMLAPMLSPLEAVSYPHVTPGGTIDLLSAACGALDLSYVEAASHGVPGRLLSRVPEEPGAAGRLEGRGRMPRKDCCVGECKRNGDASEWSISP